MLFNAELPPKIQSKDSNQTRGESVFTDHLVVLGSGLMVWAIRERSSPLIMILCSLKLFARIERSKELAKSFSELLTNSESEE